MQLPSQSAHPDPTRPFVLPQDAPFYSGVHCYNNYLKYVEAGICTARYKRAAWRQAGYIFCEVSSASCAMYAALELLTEHQFDLFVRWVEHEFNDDGGLSHALTPLELSEGLEEVGFKGRILAVTPDQPVTLDGGIARLTLLHMTCALGEQPEPNRAFVLVLFNDGGEYAPHWLPATSWRLNAAIRLAREESAALLKNQLWELIDNADPEQAFPWLSLMDEIRNGFLPPSPDIHLPGFDDERPAMGPINRPADVRRAMDIVPHYDAPEENFGDDLSTRGNLKISALVGLHPVDLPNRSLDAVASGPVFYYTGSLAHTPKTTCFTVRGYPGFVDKLSAIFYGKIAWELHPDVIFGAVVNSTSLVYVRLSEVNIINPAYLASGCFNPSCVGNISTTRGAYTLVDPFDIECQGSTYRFFRLYRTYSTVLGAVRRLLPVSIEQVKEVSLAEFTVDKLPDQSYFDSKRSWLRAVFALLASHAPAELKGIINDQRNMVLSALDQDELHYDFDPVLLVRGVIQMQICISGMMCVQGRGPAYTQAPSPLK